MIPREKEKANKSQLENGDLIKIAPRNFLGRGDGNLPQISSQMARRKFVFATTSSLFETINRIAGKGKEQTLMAWIDIRSRTHNTEKANICFTFSEGEKDAFLGLLLLRNIPRR
jgi:hypothetical protein